MPELKSRSFKAKREDGTFVDLVVSQPTRKELECADLELSAAFNRALLAGLPTRARMLRKLRENGLWSSEQERELNEIRDRGISLETQLEGEITDEKAKAELVLEHEGILRKLNEIRADVEAMLNHTADAKSEECRRNFLIACTTTVAGGDRMWTSVEDFLNETDLALVDRAAYEFTMFSNGQKSRWEEINGKPDEPTAPPAEPTAAAPAVESPPAPVAPPAPEAAPAAETPAPAAA